MEYNEDTDLINIDPFKLKTIPKGDTIEHFKSLSIKYTKFLNSTHIIVLLGWLGSHMKHVSKISEIYLKNHISCICVTPKVDYNLSVKKVNKESVEKLIELIKNQKVIFHIFSGTGFLYYYEIIQRVNGKKPIFSLSKVIFDSAPPNFGSIIGYSRAMIAVYKSRYYKGKEKYSYPSHWFLTPLICVILFLYNVISCCKLKKEFLSIDENVIKYHKSIENLKELYIYSKKDYVVLSSEVENFIEKSKKNGKRKKDMIQKYEFEKSRHVLHFKMFPKRYFQLVKKFLNN